MPRPKRRFVPLLRVLARAHPDLVEPESAIVEGVVLVDGRVVTNPAALVPVGAAIRIARARPLQGESKLDAALDQFQVAVAGRAALDVGAAAGGFTAALLAAGARRVFAVDVGFGQLAGALRQDPRVVVLERTNVSALDSRRVPDAVELVVVDVSYLAVADAVGQLGRITLAPHADLVALVKPMFELRLPHLPDDPAAVERAVTRAARGVEAAGWELRGWMHSPVRGHRGAAEAFLHATRAR